MKRIIFLVITVIAGSVSSHDAAAQCSKHTSRQERIDETVHSGVMCCTNGWASYGSPIGGGLACGAEGTLCTKVRVHSDIVDCNSGMTTLGGVLQCPGIGAPDCCSCDSGSIDFLNQHKDGSTEPDSYGCEVLGCGATGNPEPQTCNGLSALNIPPFDAGCKDDEHSCKRKDKDGAPVRYSSGRVETNPITVFALPTPEGISFEYRVLCAPLA